MVFRTHDLLVRRRTQLTNALRGHLAEYGRVAPKGKAHMDLLAGLIEEGDIASAPPAATRAMLKVMCDHLHRIEKHIADLDREIAKRAREDDAARRLALGSHAKRVCWSQSRWPTKLPASCEYC